MSREYLREFLDKRKDEPMLEIGPLTTPFLSKNKYNVYYSDIRDKEGIFEIYRNDKGLGATPQEVYKKIMPIDYVVTDTYLNAVGDKRFSVIFSSHVIEHTHDVIRHLLELSEILNDGGYIVLAIPDKRYCFDHFREVTPFRDAFDIFINNDIKNTARLAFDSSFLQSPCNDPLMYINNEMSFSAVASDTNRAQIALNIYNQVKNGIFADVHHWVFTDTSFLNFLRDGLRTSILPYKLHSFYPTSRGCFEFSVVIQKDTSILKDDTKRKMEIEKLVELVESFDSHTSSEADRVRMEIIQLYENSTSWKITKPFRAIISLLKAHR